MILRKAICVLLLLSLLELGVGDDLIKIVTNFFKQQYLPVKVTAFLCWNEADTMILIKSMINHGIPISTYNRLQYKDKHLPTIESYEHIFYLVDSDCPYANKILEIANRDKLFLFPHRWLLLENVNRTLTLEEYRLPVNSRLYLLNKHRNENGVHKIKSVYNIGNSRELLCNDVASWNGAKFDYFNYITDIRNRSDLRREPLNVSMVAMHNDTLDSLEDMKKAEHDAITKLNYILVNHMVDIINCSATLIYRNTWGYLDPTTKVYNGLFGDLQSGLSEWGGCPGFLSAERTGFVDFIGDTTPTNARFIFRAPPLSAVSNVFTLPFTTNVWYAIYILLAIIFAVIYVIIRWEWFQKMLIDNKDNGVNMLQPRIVDVVQMEIGAICQQGSESEPRSSAGRIATLFLFLSLMFMYTSYSANIVALLQSTTDKFKTLQDFLDSNVELGAENIPYNRYIFRSQNEEVYQAISRKISSPNKPDNYLDAKVGVERMRSEFFAFHAEKTVIYYIVSNTFLESEKCGLIEIKYWNIDPFIPIKKKSAFKELVKVGYAKLYENGFRRRNANRYYTLKPPCTNQGANFTSVSINDCYFAALCFSIGVAVSLLIFLAEKIVHKYKSREIKGLITGLLSRKE